MQRGKELNGQILKEFPARIWQTLGWSALAWMSIPVSIGVEVLMPRASVEITYAFEAVLMALALYLLVPVLRHYVQVNSEIDSPTTESRSADFCFLIFAVVTSTGADYVFLQYGKHDQGLSQLATHTVALWLLATCVSTATSLPYAFAMIGVTLRELPPGLFVYGTLHPNRAPAEIREEAKQLVWRSEGSVAGQLQDLGEYPALLTSTAGQTVEGVVFCLPSSGEALLAAFDHYEGYDPASPETSLFLRELRPVTFPDGHTERHWVYVYNREVPAAE